MGGGVRAGGVEGRSEWVIRIGFDGLDLVIEMQSLVISVEDLILDPVCCATFWRRVTRTDKYPKRQKTRHET